MNAELAAHVELAIEDYVRAGHSRDEVGRMALLRLGGVGPTHRVHLHGAE
jgi:hypothetical protein